MKGTDLSKKATVAMACCLARGLIEADANGEYFALTEEGRESANSRWAQLSDESKLLLSLFIADMEIESYQRDDAGC